MEIFYEGIPCIDALRYHPHDGLDSGTRESSRWVGCWQHTAFADMHGTFSLGYSHFIPMSLIAPDLPNIFVQASLHLNLAKRLAEFHV